MITCILSGYSNILNVFLLHPHKQVQQPLRHTILLLTAACAAALETMPESWQSFCFVQRDAGPERCRGHPAGHSQMCWVGRGGLHSCLHRQCGNNNDNGHLAHLTCDDPKCWQIHLHVYIYIQTIKIQKHRHTPRHISQGNWTEENVHKVFKED